MSLTISTNKPGKPRSSVTVGGELDEGGVRGYVLLTVTPHLALLTPGVARDVARALVRFAERARPIPRKRTKKPARQPDPQTEVTRDTARMFRALGK